VYDPIGGLTFESGPYTSFCVESYHELNQTPFSLYAYVYKEVCFENYHVLPKREPPPPLSLLEFLSLV